MEGRGRGSTMESMESSVVSSPEVLRKPESLQPKSPTSDSTEKTTYVRFLVSNAAAGSVIGKGGSTITDFQSQSGARIQLSCNHEFSPGTTDRIIMVSGAIYEILKSVELILSKLLSELDNEDENNAEPRTKVRLVVPNSSCGGIIGKGGATVRSFIEESQASIKISPQENNYYGQNDRLVTLTGTLDEQMHAIDLIVSKLAEDPHYSQSMNTPSSYQGFQGVPYTYVLPPVATAPYNGRSYRPNGNGGKFQNTKMENKLAEELYGESLQLTKPELRLSSADDKQNDSNGDNLDHEDGSLWDGSDDGVDQVSDLDREWQRRHDEFHTIGYRDGLMAGKETSAQEGFNVGFKQSVLVGYNWGLVRGVTSAFVALRDKVKEKLVETQDKRDEFQGLHESMYSLSTADTLRLFSEDIEAKEQGKRIEVSLHTEDLPEQSSINYNIGNYFGQLQSLILDSPAIDLQLPAHK